MEKTVFNAPWSRSLKIISALSAGILASVAIIGLLNGAGKDLTWFAATVCLPLLILGGAAFFMIRRYELGDGVLCIERLGWRSQVDLSELQSVEVDPAAMQKSIRAFGNGGLFCFAGKFWSRKLGFYRAFASDPARAVVLRFVDRLVVVTPHDPRQFAREIGVLKAT